MTITLCLPPSRLIMDPPYSLMFTFPPSKSASPLLQHSVSFSLNHPLSNSVTSPYASHLSPLPSLPARCLWFTFEVFIPPAVPLFLPPSHSHLILMLAPSLSALFFPISPWFPLLLLSLFLSPSSRTSRRHRRRRFHHYERNGGECNTPPCHPVTPSSSLRVDSSASAFWDASCPPSLSSRSPLPIVAALGCSLCWTEAESLQHPLMKPSVEASLVLNCRAA